MLNRTIAKFLFYAVALVLLLWTSSLTYSFLSMALPNSFWLVPLLGLVVFDAGMVAWLFVFVSRASSTNETRGYASAYAPGVMEATVRWRLDNGAWRTIPASEWIYRHAIATNDCSEIGRIVTLIDPGGTGHRVLIADCGGADGGAEWMTANNIVAELDWDLWQELTAMYGRPLRIALR